MDRSYRAHWAPPRTLRCDRVLLEWYALSGVPRDKRVAGTVPRWTTAYTTHTNGGRGRGVIPDRATPNVIASGRLYSWAATNTYTTRWNPHTVRAGFTARNKRRALCAAEAVWKGVGGVGGVVGVRDSPGARKTALRSNRVRPPPLSCLVAGPHGTTERMSVGGTSPTSGGRGAVDAAQGAVGIARTAAAHRMAQLGGGTGTTAGAAPAVQPRFRPAIFGVDFSPWWNSVRPRG
ncbi:hypothetical protein B0H16DRAFT_1476207, partial [Mycena metata]